MFYSSVYINSKILKIASFSQNFRLTWPELVFFFIFVLRVLFLRNKNTINQTLRVPRTLPCPPSVSSHNFRTIIGRNFTFWYVVGSSYETEAKIIWRHDNVHTFRTISHFIPTYYVSHCYKKYTGLHLRIIRCCDILWSKILLNLQQNAEYVM